MKKILTKFLKVFFCFSLIVFGVVAFSGRTEQTPSFSADAAASQVTVRFYKEYDTESRRILLYEKTFEAGEEIAYPGDPKVAPKPEKESKNSNYHWEFDGWEDKNGEVIELSTIEEDIDVFATYKQVFDVFTVNFYAKTNSFTETYVDSQKFRFDDEVRTYTGKTPAKQSTIAYTYKYIGWEKEDGERVELKNLTREDFSDEVNPTIKLYAVFEQVPIDYPITYHYDGGTIHNLKQTYNYDEDEFTLQEPTPDLEGVEFIGWLGTDIPANQPQKNVKINPKELGALKAREYTAVYSSTKYQVTFEIFEPEKEPGSVDRETISVTYGSKIEINNAEAKITIGGEVVTATASTENKAYTFTFLSFETTETEVKHDITILVKFTSKPKVYNLHYDDNGGTLLYPHQNSYTIESGTVYLRETKLEKYTYIGWNETREDGEIIDNSPVKSFVVSGIDDLRERYYKAAYQENVYIVTFVVQNPSYGEVSSGEQRGDRVVITGIKEGTSISYDKQAFHLGDVMVTATPAEEDYGFVYSFSATGWRFDDADTVTADFEVIVVFTATAKEYFLSYSTGSLEVQKMDGTVLNPYTNIKYGEQFKIIYTLSEHNHITSFKLNDVDLTEFADSSSGEIIITFNEDYISDDSLVIRIEFFEAIDTYTVTFSVNDESRGTVSKQQLDNVEYGTEISVLPNGNLTIGSETITAQENESGLDYCSYVFEGWETSGKTIVDDDINIVASFGIKYEKYAVNFDETHISVQRKQGEELIEVSAGEELDWGTQLVLTYEPTEHYHCTRFSVDGDDKIATLMEYGKVEITLTKQITIEADEAINKYQITFGEGIEVKKQGGETVSSGNLVDALTVLEISYTLSKNYKILTFTISGVDYSESESPVTYTITSDTQIVFEEEKDKIPITSASTEHGSFTLSADSMEWESDVTITVTPEKYFKFKRAYYIVEGEEVQHEIEDLTFKMPNDKITVYVEFEREFYFVENSEKGVSVVVDVDRVSAEPQIVFEEASLEFSELVSNRIKGNHLQIYIFKIMVEQTEIKDVPVTIILTIPEAFGNGTLDLFKTIVVEENTAFEVQQFSKEGNTISFTMDSVLPLVLVERGENASGTPSAPTNQDKVPKNNTTMIIIISVSAGVVVAAAITVTVVIVKKRKIHRK